MSNQEEGFQLPRTEEEVLKFWKHNHIFEKSVQNRKGKKKFVFYEGPPTANGRPGIHHLLARSFKDIILRYKTMQGFFVPRRGGWDTHGLPVEIEVEKKLGLKSKREIEKYGVGKFNAACRESVWQYREEWERLTERMGFWLDLKNAYVTYETSYVETLWWVIAEFAKKKLLYKSHKVVPWCTRCGTALSSHELAQGYSEVTDNSAYIKFKLKLGQKIGKDFTTNNKTFILSWTTTPWTLPGNVALAVGGKIKYKILKNLENEETYVLASNLVLNVLKDQKIHEIKEVNGGELVGLSYEPLFRVKKLETKKSHKVYSADFVTTTDGTGVVHTAVMYGVDDYELGKKNGLPEFHTVGEDGRFVKEVSGFFGLLVKNKETEEKIFAYLTKNNFLFRVEPYTHEYPFCWRCKTALLYYARDSWFVATTKVRDLMIKENQKINWQPKHIRDGRFGEWLKDMRDWNFSRERYWGTPLPVWECKKCDKFETIGGIKELALRTGKSKNNYIVMRHGQAETQILKIWDSGNQNMHLTDLGKKQVLATAKKLKKEKIQMIFSSDILRTKETSAIVAKTLGIKKVNFDKRLRELQVAEFSGKPGSEYAKRFPTYADSFANKPEGGESLRDLRARLNDFVEETEKKYRGKNILIISHEWSIWILTQAMEGWTEKEAIEEMEKRERTFIQTGDARKQVLRILPKDETGEINLHKPYVDSIVFDCKKCKQPMKRVKEIADVWFDSGAMPLAQDHYPFDKALNPKPETLNPNNYPADYISEAMDQTRGWFYTLLSVATLLGKSTPYRNVVCLGLINDKHGQKMSKSKGNIVDPWEMMNKHGVDAVRWYFFTATPPGEPKNFDELEIVKSFRKFHMILWNSATFYATYANKKALDAKGGSSQNVLDQWILERLKETTSLATEHLDRYEIREAALQIEGLVDDLSRWYIRRSRRRFQKPTSEEDLFFASQTLGWVLRDVSGLIAPFIPFFAEALYEKIGKKEESVHLEEWPERKSASKIPASVKTSVGRQKSRLLEAMEEVRRLASLGLAKRTESQIKVRQPLASLKIKNSKLEIGSKEILEILKDEVNVKTIIFDQAIEGEVELDINITTELREEGLIREIMRMVQDLRAAANFSPKDEIALMMELPKELQAVVLKNEKLMKKDLGVREMKYQRSDKFEAEIITKIEQKEVWIGVRKI